MTAIRDADKHFAFAVDEEARVVEYRTRRNGWEYITRFWWNRDGTYTIEATRIPAPK